MKAVDPYRLRELAANLRADGYTAISNRLQRASWEILSLQADRELLWNMTANDQVKALYDLILATSQAEQEVHAAWRSFQNWLFHIVRNMENRETPEYDAFVGALNRLREQTQKTPEAR